MNVFRQALLPVFRLKAGIQKRTMGYVGAVSVSMRYCCVHNIDYTGKKYIIPYTCTSYSDEIDGLILDAVADIPSDDYNVSIGIVESVVNQQLKKQYGYTFNVKLLPPAQSMIPPCHNLL